MVCEFPYSGDGRLACKLLYALFFLLQEPNGRIWWSYRINNVYEVCFGPTDTGLTLVIVDGAVRLQQL